MIVTFTLLSFAFGASLASFANMWSYRHPINGTLPLKLRQSKRSFCDYCHRQLSWWENIPLLSFFILRGKTRCCHHSLSWRYPLTEFLGGAMGVLVLRGIERRWLPLLFSPLFSGLFFLLLLIVLFCSLIIFSYDLYYLFIPLYPLIGLLISASFFWWVFGAHNWATLAGVGINLLLMIFLFLVTKKKGLGLGDLFLVVFFPLLVGPIGGIMTVWLAFVLGAVVGLLLVAFHRGIGFKSLIPLGPFLIFSFWFSWAFNWWQILLQ